MSNSMFTAATGMEAQNTRIAVIANNLANMNTTGFKAARAEFQDLLYQIEKSPGSEQATGVVRPNGIQIGTGVQVVSTPNMMNQGNLEQTARALDVAIEGRGFFQVQLPSGETGYTRSGSLAINGSGQLVTQDGYLLIPSVTVTTTNTDRTIGVDGTISSTNPTDGTVTNEGTLQLASFPNEAGLRAAGGTIYLATEASGSAVTGTAGQDGVGELQQGFLETSNVNMAEELIRMILAQRAFEMNSKVIQTSDQMLSATNQIR